jgi:hypothetical protein
MIVAPMCGRKIRDADQLAARRGHAGACRQALSGIRGASCDRAISRAPSARPAETGVGRSARAPRSRCDPSGAQAPDPRRASVRSTGHKIGPCSWCGRHVRAREPEEGSDCPRPGPWTKAKTQVLPRVQRMIGIDCIAPIQNSNQLQNGVGRRSAPTSIGCPKRPSSASATRVSCAGATQVERSWSSPNGENPEGGLYLRAVAAFTRLIARSEEPEEMNERPRRAYRYRRRRRKGPSQAPARSARPCVAGASRCGRSVSAGTHGEA